MQNELIPQLEADDFFHERLNRGFSLVLKHLSEQIIFIDIGFGIKFLVVRSFQKFLLFCFVLIIKAISS